MSNANWEILIVGTGASTIFDDEGIGSYNYIWLWPGDRGAAVDIATGNILQTIQLITGAADVPSENANEGRVAEIPYRTEWD